jgi:phospholipid/cholesterol/gamma-HCH transport system ATP-binding protein
MTDARRPPPFAQLQNVAMSYGEKVVLRDFSLDVVQGAITCIIGLSGAGKSTVLRLINGLRRPDRGRVIVDGTEVSALPERELIDFRRKIGFAFQFSALFDSLTIGDNVALPLREHSGLPEDEIRRRVADTLESVGLAEAYDRYPAELSGGMVKRAGFARAVITNPACVLYDEPTTGQDPIITHVLTQLIVRLRQQMGGTAVVVSHDLVSIFAMADYVAMLFEGRIVAYGTVDEIKESPNPVVQQFLKGSEVGPIPI